MRRSDSDLGLAGFSSQTIDRGDDASDGLVPRLERSQHLVFGQLGGAGFHHHDGFCATADDQVEPALRPLGVGRVDDVLAIHQAHPNRRHSPLAWDGRQGQGR